MKEETNHILFSLLVKVILSVAVFLQPCMMRSQCTSPISNFPYTENFETLNGNWTEGGIFADWAWGTPSKAVINAAGSGSKCWIAGGLNVAGYNSNENAWLKSRCFNFTNLATYSNKGQTNILRKGTVTVIY